MPSATCRPNKKKTLYNVTPCTCNKYSLFTWSSCREDWLVPVSEGKILEFLLFEVSSWLVKIFNGLYMLFATLLKYGVREPSKNFPLLLTCGFKCLATKLELPRGERFMKPSSLILFSSSFHAFLHLITILVVYPQLRYTVK